MYLSAPPPPSPPQNPPECRYVGRGIDSDLPLPSDGPDIKWIDHRTHMTSSQENMTSSQEVMDCRQCGKELADYLLRDLHIGKKKMDSQHSGPHWLMTVLMHPTMYR